MTSPTAEGQRVAGEWLPFVGEYDKRFYEARHPSRPQDVTRHFWPNAGMLVGTDGCLLTIKPEHGYEFRPCTCGHKWGGCLPTTSSREGERG